MSSDNTSVHRLLDEAFAGVTMTPETQDLKEEIRANLMDRVADLVSDGVPQGTAVRRAVDELGDIRAVVDAELPGRPSDDDEAPGAAVPGRGSEGAASAARRNHVPPTKGYVAGVVGASVTIALATGLPVLVLVNGPDDGSAGLLASVVLAYLSPLLAALAVGWIVSASLHRETTTNFPMPRGRAAAYGAGWALVTLGATSGLALYTVFLNPALLTTVACVVLGVALLAYLKATQTNRTKPWALEQGRRHAEAGSRFDEDPAAAARFGLYTVVLWALTGAAIIVVGFTAGWIWVTIPALLGLAVFMLLLARMNFGPAGR